MNTIASRHGPDCLAARPGAALGSKVAKASASGLASMSASTATVTAACCSPASRFFTPFVSDVRPCPKVLSAQLRPNAARPPGPPSPANADAAAGAVARAPARFMRRMRLTYAIAARSVAPAARRASSMGRRSSSEGRDSAVRRNTSTSRSLSAAVPVPFCTSSDTSAIVAFPVRDCSSSWYSWSSPRALMARNRAEAMLVCLSTTRFCSVSCGRLFTAAMRPAVFCCMSWLGSMSADTLAPVFLLSSATAALYSFRDASTAVATLGNCCRAFASQNGSPTPTS
mmetsp:Transcript_8338/g.25017  ORF Transcript_8338/g.25017 Transcript_8338/m.25017 type:complete len:284 (-) Transcript_8338:1113-1964(-)